MAQVGMHEARKTLARPVERAQAGEDVVITRRGKPIARLVPVRPTSSMESIRGIWRGRVHMADDFDELPDDIAEAVGMR